MLSRDRKLNPGNDINVLMQKLEHMSHQRNLNKMKPTIKIKSPKKLAVHSRPSTGHGSTSQARATRSALSGCTSTNTFMKNKNTSFLTAVQRAELASRGRFNT